MRPSQPVRKRALALAGASRAGLERRERTCACKRHRLVGRARLEAPSPTTSRGPILSRCSSVMVSGTSVFSRGLRGAVHDRHEEHALPAPGVRRRLGDLCEMTKRRIRLPRSPWRSSADRAPLRAPTRLRPWSATGDESRYGACVTQSACRPPSSRVSSPCWPATDWDPGLRNRALIPALHRGGPGHL